MQLYLFSAQTAAKQCAYIISSSLKDAYAADSWMMILLDEVGRSRGLFQFADPAFD
jgi:hypothetical protein